MKAVLAHRHYGIHRTVKTFDLPKGRYVRNHKEPTVFEDKLLSVLPNNFLPVPANKVLLLVGTKYGGTAVSKPERFKTWGKYFDCYSLTVEK